MMTTNPSNRNIISHFSPSHQTVHTVSDIQRLFLRRPHPTSLQFRLEDNNNRINPNLSKKLMTLFSKKTFTLKNPPLKEVLAHKGLSKQLRSLQVRPRDAAKHITQITKRLPRVEHFAILDENDIFVPMRIKNKVHPLRSLKSFIYNHEFCRDFLRCAWYVSDLKIRKTSLDLVQLKKLQHLEKIHLILKTKYLSLPEEDTKFAGELGRTLLKLPLVKHVILEQEVDPETRPYTFFEIQRALLDKAKVHLVADFVDVSSQRNKNFSVEKIFHTIKDSGINNVKVKYVGVAQAINRLGRSFYAPLHIKSDLYVRFIKAIMEIPFENVQFMPIVHSTYIDHELRDSIVEFTKPDAKLHIPKLNLIYNLDVIELANIDLMLDVFNQKLPSYDITIISMANIRRALAEKLEEHFSAALAKIKEFKAGLSLQIVIKDQSTLATVVQFIAPKVEKMTVRGLTIQIKDYIDKNTLESVAELLKSSGLSGICREFEIDLSQRESPKIEELYQFLSRMAQENYLRMNKISLSYHNSRDCEEVIKKMFERLRAQHKRSEFECEINNERKIYE